MKRLITNVMIITLVIFGSGSAFADDATLEKLRKKWEPFPTHFSTVGIETIIKWEAGELNSDKVQAKVETKEDQELNNRPTHFSIEAWEMLSNWNNEKSEKRHVAFSTPAQKDCGMNDRPTHFTEYEWQILSNWDFGSKKEITPVAEAYSKATN